MFKKILVVIPVALLALALMVQPGGATAVSPSSQPQSVISTTQPVSWTLANAETAGDWLTYAPADDVTAAVVDGKYLWVASTGGLLRWNRQDGTLTQYLAPQVPLPSNDLRGLLLHDGKLYISGYGGVAVFDRDSHWTTYGTRDLGWNNATYGVMAMIDGVLWVGNDYGLAKLQPEGYWESVPLGDLLLSQVTRIEERADGVYITGTGDDLFYKHRTVVVHYVKGRWQTLDTPVPDYLTAPDGSWWKSEQERVVKSVDQGKTWRTVYEGGIWPHPLAFDQAEAFLAGDGGIVVLKNDRVVATYRFADVGPELNYINTIKRDEAGRMWIGTDGRGLTMFDGQQWHNWQPENSGIREDAIRGMALADDKVYLGLFGCAGCGGVAIYDIKLDQWTNLWPEESELSGGGVGGIAIDPQGRAYFPTSAGILDIYDHGRWQHIKMTPTPGSVILSPDDGLFDHAGHYWVATSGLGLGLWEYDGNEWHTYLSGYDVSALALDKEGRLWAATSTGLVVRDIDGAWHTYLNNTHPFQNDWLQDVEVDADGRIWTVSTDHLYIFNGKDWQTISPHAVGTSLWGDAIGFDAQNHAWVGTGLSGAAVFIGKPKFGPFAGLVDPPAFQEQQPRATESRSSPWSLLTQGLCLLVFAPGAVAFERVYRKSRNKRARS